MFLFALCITVGSIATVFVSGMVIGHWYHRRRRAIPSRGERAATLTERARASVLELKEQLVRVRPDLEVILESVPSPDGVLFLDIVVGSRVLSVAYTPSDQTFRVGASGHKCASVNKAFAKVLELLGPALEMGARTHRS